MNLQINQAPLRSRNLAYFLCLTVIGALVSFYLLDSQAQHFTAQLSFRGDVRQLLDFIGGLGHGTFCIFVLVTVACLDRRNWKALPLIALAPAVAGVLVSLLKHNVHRPRPAIVAGWEARVSESMFNQESYQSFPSGHTATAFALATSLAMIYPHGKAYFFTLATLVGIQRVFVQAHYPSDVFAGAAIGYLVAFTAAKVLSRVSGSAPISQELTP